MDWKFILSLTPDDLEDDRKDELYNTIAWFDSDSEEISIKKFKALFKVSQEVLKYKGEQVETLLHELDELATKQGEEEARRSELEADIRSSRSKTSSSIEYENMEQKYMELRIKYKKQLKSNEKLSSEADKMKKQINALEQENKHLQAEVQLKVQEGSDSSEISETMKDQHKELVEVVHSKNKQISDLLQDIEDVENENSVLREKLTNVRDELSSATKEITSMNEQLKAGDLKLEESFESLQRATVEIENLKEEIEDLHQQKGQLEDQMHEFTEEVNKRIDNWKQILDEKDALIKDLKQQGASKTTQSSSPSPSSLPSVHEQTYVNALSKALNEREQQLLELQTQLKEATEEMEESTKIIEKLKTEREENSTKINDLSQTVKDMKKQLKIAHERCKELQEEVAFVEKTAIEKDADIKEIIDQLKENGQIDVSYSLKQIQEIKAQNRLQEKQIINFVKTSNKLQEACNHFEQENSFLREKLGLGEDEQIIITGVSLKQKKQKKELESLKREVSELEDENISLKSEIQKLNRKVSSLSDKLLDLGAKPPKSEDFREIIKTVGKEEKEDYKKEVKFLVEENEALRKGMHEILDNINKKKGHALTEIKSETLEKLLRALDVKHISGWYHPAMRLQAEVHNVEGINNELREQLRVTRLELEKYKTEPKPGIDLPNATERKIVPFSHGDLSLLDANAIENINKNLQLILSGGIDRSDTSELEKSLENYKNDYIIIQEQVGLLYKQYQTEKEKWEEQLKAQEDETQRLQETLEITQSKLTILKESSTEDEKLKNLEQLVSEKVMVKKKNKYLQEDSCKQLKIIEELNKDLSNAEVACVKKISEIARQNKSLTIKLKISENLNEMCVDSVVFKEMKKDFDNLTIKHRELLDKFQKSAEEKLDELNIVNESLKMLELEKVELKNKLIETTAKLLTGDKTDENPEKLSRKIAECEVSEITERQRANHTNNLYELVKEQLKKSEERFKDFSRYNEDILHKNLLLQEQLKDAEENLLSYIDSKLYEELQKSNNDLLKENETLQLSVGQLEEDLKVAKMVAENVQVWTASKEQELLNLKHQVVDLMSVSEDKMQIAQLHSDLMHCRKMENSHKSKLESLFNELDGCKKQYDGWVNKLELEKSGSEEREAQLKRKISMMQEMMLKQKMQYIGCIPLESEERYVEKLRQIENEKHQAFISLNNAKQLENEKLILKEQAEIELNHIEEQKSVISGDKEEINKVLDWIEQKKSILLNEIKYRRQAEFKEAQLIHIVQRVQTQDDQILQLEEQVLHLYKQFDLNNVHTPDISIRKIEESVRSKPQSPIIIMTKSEEIQTVEIVNDENAPDESKISNLKSELINVKNESAAKDQQLEQLRGKISELEVTLSMFRTQLGDRQSQISFYEKHILELQNEKQEKGVPPGPGGDSIAVGSGNEEVLTLKNTVKALQEAVAVKEKSILELQNLLKVDRDNHSLAAASLQEERQKLQKSLAEEKQRVADLEDFVNKTHPNRMAVEQYICQVHSLEKHTAELHTTVSNLDAQLQSSRQEAVRWRALANDRLQSMEELRKSLEDQHKNELAVYKEDSEKWREEVNDLKQLIAKHRGESSSLGADIQKLLKEKEDKVHELTVLLRQARTDAKRLIDKPEHDLSPKISELELSKDMLQKELESLKKRHDVLLNRERSCRDEVRELKAQLTKKATLSARSDKSDRSIKEQLQKKVTSLENEIIELKDKLTNQIAINESHRVAITDDFEKWKKQKHWQQTTEKLKNKLKERDVELEKLHQTCTGYRSLIERLEREKHNLENRVKNLKQDSRTLVSNNEMEMLKIDNMKLLADVEALSSKLEMQQHHSGGLGAAMLQEKLEAQERKIAILELSARGSVEVRAELERLQTSISSLQKTNLCIEAENLELKLDLEKCSKEVPHLKEQIHHLESYIEVLKAESCQQQPNKEDSGIASSASEQKKVSELERTVFILKRVVEKLQAENKRFLGGKRPFSDRAGSADKLRRDHLRLKEQYTESIQKVAQLEKELTIVSNKAKINRPVSHDVEALSEELSEVREQLELKSHLLDKVKVLLHRAATKEKALLQEIGEFKRKMEGRG